MKIDPQYFYLMIRRKIFAGILTQSHVDGMNLILDKFETSEYTDFRHLAYILATAFHETGNKMVPVREGFAKTDAEARRIVSKYSYGQPDGITGHVYYGRGLVQITWKENYDRLGKLLGYDFVNNPDLTLDPKISVDILFEGMLKGVSKKGDFTGKSLETYFNETTNDPLGARRIINGNDRAGLIEHYHNVFLNALRWKV